MPPGTRSRSNPPGAPRIDLRNSSPTPSPGHAGAAVAPPRTQQGLPTTTTSPQMGEAQHRPQIIVQATSLKHPSDPRPPSIPPSGQQLQLYPSHEGEKAVHTVPSTPLPMKIQLQQACSTKRQGNDEEGRQEQTGVQTGLHHIPVHSRFEDSPDAIYMTMHAQGSQSIKCTCGLYCGQRCVIQHLAAHATYIQHLAEANDDMKRTMLINTALQLSNTRGKISNTTYTDTISTTKKSSGL